MFDDLIELLKLLKLRPASGWGRTIIVWHDGEVIMLTKEEDIKPETIN